MCHIQYLSMTIGYILMLASLPTTAINYPVSIPFKKHASTPMTSLHPSLNPLFMAAKDIDNI
jgi:hypothetical protein